MLRKMSHEERYYKTRILGVLECVMILLGYPLCETSIPCIYLNTDVGNIRKILKKKSLLDGLADNSPNIFYDTPWEKYLKRDKLLEKVTYFEYYMFFEYRYFATK